MLFHGAWVQPAAGIDSADPVLITGGSRYGDHSELEGYVVLTVERYLHLRADLWMARFGTGSALDVDVPVLPTPVVTVGATTDSGKPRPELLVGAGVLVAVVVGVVVWRQRR